jgi:hypothetical protein
LFVASAHTGDDVAITTVFRVMGFIGYAVSIFFAYRLYQNSLKEEKKEKKKEK